MKQIKSIFALKGVPYMNDKKYIDKADKIYLYTMTPDTYIIKAAKILGMTYEQVINTRLKDHHSYLYIGKAAKNGSLTIPVLDYNNNTQDGLHRAMWAKEVGLKQIPVFVYGEANEN